SVNAIALYVSVRFTCYLNLHSFPTRRSSDLYRYILYTDDLPRFWRGSPSFKGGNHRSQPGGEYGGTASGRAAGGRTTDVICICSGICDYSCCHGKTNTVRCECICS